MAVAATANAVSIEPAKCTYTAEKLHWDAGQLKADVDIDRLNPAAGTEFALDTAVFMRDCRSNTEAMQTLNTGCSPMPSDKYPLHLLCELAQAQLGGHPERVDIFLDHSGVLKPDPDEHAPVHMFDHPQP